MSDTETHRETRTEDRTGSDSALTEGADAPGEFSAPRGALPPRWPRARAPASPAAR